MEHWDPAEIRVEFEIYFIAESVAVLFQERSYRKSIGSFLEGIARRTEKYPPLILSLSLSCTLGGRFRWRRPWMRAALRARI